MIEWKDNDKTVFQFYVSPDPILSHTWFDKEMKLEMIKKYTTLLNLGKLFKFKLPIISNTTNIWQIGYWAENPNNFSHLSPNTLASTCLKLHKVLNISRNCLINLTVIKSKSSTKWMSRSDIGWQQKANYANSSWSTETWQPVTCSCPWTRSVKSLILASPATSTLTRLTGRKPRGNVSKV